MTDTLEDDYDDAAEAVLRVTEALRLAGVDTDAIADALVSKAILFNVAEGYTMSNPKKNVKGKSKPEREAEPQLDDDLSKFGRMMTQKIGTWPHEQSDEYTIADMSDEEVDAFAHKMSEWLAKKK